MSRNRSRSESPRTKAIRAIRSKLAAQNFDWHATPAEMFHLETFKDVGISFSDRSVALVCSANIELSLEIAIKTHFVPLTPDQLNSIFIGLDRDAPLSNFGAKIRIAHALGVFGELMLEDLKMIQLIRNYFAHSANHIDFSEEAVSDAVGVLNWPQYGIKNREKIATDGWFIAQHMNTPKEMFSETCKWTALRLAMGLPGKKSKGIPTRIPDEFHYPDFPWPETPPQEDE